MAESIAVSSTSDRAVIYSELAPQVSALIDGEPDLVANLANVAAVLKEAFQFFWVGFYLVKDGQLVLGPFQGPLACTRINFAEGVCGHAFSLGETVIVPNVDEFPGHIACSSASRSEIVVPLKGRDGRIHGVLDVDSEHLDDFSVIDREGLENLIRTLESMWPDR